MSKVLGISLVLLVSGLAVAQTAVKLSEKFEKKLEAADAAYQQAVAKADNARFYAVQKATADRVKVLKQVMSEVTKSGDLDGANDLKSKIAAAEATGGVRARPKNIVKFGGHEYALIEDKVTWHVAKRMCEEMGGHLAILDNAEEAQFLRNLSGRHDTWAGATDEDKEDEWKWIDGTKVPSHVLATWRTKDDTGEQHHLVWFNPDNQWVAGRCGGRQSFLCEWE